MWKSARARLDALRRTVTRAARERSGVLALGAVWLAGVAMGLGGCSQLLTTAPEAGDVFDSPLEGLTGEELAAFTQGDAQFARAFAPAEGLGPIFNNVSCASCHSGDGRGRPENALTRFGLGGGPAIELGGPQLQTQALPGALAEVLPAGVESSLRLPPPVFGVGLIEGIPDSTILALADPGDLDGDGISGRPNYVTPLMPMSAHGPQGATSVLGRFSRKAQVASIHDQTVAAYHQDMGITSEFLPTENVNPLAGAASAAADRVSDPELSTTDVRAVVAYLRMLAPPAPGEMTEQRARGQAVFSTIKCASCHVPSMRTGFSNTAALNQRTAEIYSDLLLHDMGDGLADYRPDGGADGREWRTTPLWGLRLMKEFLNGQAFLLHDGRARSVEEAILLHGGEAAAARDSFQALSAGDRAALLDFVESR